MISKLRKLFKKQTTKTLLQNDLQVTTNRLIEASKELIEAEAIVAAGTAICDGLIANAVKAIEPTSPNVYFELSSEKVFHSIRDAAKLKLLNDTANLEVTRANFEMLCKRYIRLSEAVKNEP